MCSNFTNLFPYSAVNAAVTKLGVHIPKYLSFSNRPINPTSLIGYSGGSIDGVLLCLDI